MTTPDPTQAATVEPCPNPDCDGGDPEGCCICDHTGWVVYGPSWTTPMDGDIERKNKS